MNENARVWLEVFKTTFCGYIQAKRQFESARTNAIRIADEATDAYAERFGEDAVVTYPRPREV
jgi:hypothetical protein